MAWLYSCIGITSLLTRILGSKLCDVIGSQSVVLAFGMCGAMVTSVLLPLAINWTWLLFFSISYGLVDGLITIGVNLSCLQVLTQKQRAQGFGRLPIAPYFGNFVWCTHRRFVKNILTKTKMDKKRVKK